MTMTTGQTSIPAQPQQQPKKEKHLVHWFRKGMNLSNSTHFANYWLNIDSNTLFRLTTSR